MLTSLFLLITGIGCSLSAHADSKAYGPPVFPEDSSFESEVHFWEAIYSRYSTEQGVIHDTQHLNIVYEVVDLSGIPSQKRDDWIRRRKQKWRDLLLSLHRNQKPIYQLSPRQQRINRLFSSIEDPKKFLKAARRSRIRFQQGQRNRFKLAYQRATRYLSLFEKIFAQHEVPPPLTRLPYVESHFYPEAESHQGALGMWQLMPQTARHYSLRLTPIMDERLDPIRSAAAAARLLKTHYEKLKSWPLALLAYNHGLWGVQKAVEELGTKNIGEILAHYEGERFGFASRHFYFQFLAALNVANEFKMRFDHVPKRLEPMPLSKYQLKGGKLIGVDSNI